MGFVSSFVSFFVDFERFGEERDRKAVRKLGDFYLEELVWRLLVIMEVCDPNGKRNLYSFWLVCWLG